MSNQSNYLKQVILEAEALEMQICEKANRYILLLKRQRDICDEQIEVAKAHINNLEADQERTKNDKPTKGSE